MEGINMNVKSAIFAMKNEMKPSMGCTEPVAIGLAVSRTGERLQKDATSIDMVISSNIFKNAYSVQIPNAGTNGIELSCALGYVLRKAGNTMEIFANISQQQLEEAKELVKNKIIKVKVLSPFYR